METFLQKMEDILELPPGSARSTDYFRECETWDSLTLLVLINQINEDYGVSVSNAEIGSMNTLQELWNLIQQKS